MCPRSRYSELNRMNVIILFAAAILWEGVAWFMHKHVMHGLGWVLHRDHHATHGRRFQKNDFYALFFAACSFLLIFFGLKNSWEPMAAAGFGVALYGVGYVTFHDIMFHKRFRGVRFTPKAKYIKRITAAHRIHHSTVTKDGATSFSFLWAPRRYGRR